MIVLFAGTMYGSRTRHSSVKGRRLNRLTNTAFPVSECKDKQEFISAKFSFNYFLFFFNHRFYDTQKVVCNQGRTTY